jgi:hypothetical protein
MTDPNDMLERVIDTLKEPVTIDRAIDRRVMDEIEGLPPHERPVSGFRSVTEWLRRPRIIRVSPLGGLAVAASLAAVVFTTARLASPDKSSFAEPSAVRPAPTASVIQFVLVAPEAASVSVVGDFNDWDLAATPLVRSEGGGVWAVTVPLSPGRYRYSFLVNGTTWLQDPNGAPELEDEFGRPNSVLTVGGA